MTRLITIPFSHYCEKARWALDRCGVAYDEDGHLPLFHYLPVVRVGANRTVPVLVDGERLVPDSTDIVAWADSRSPGTLIPTDWTRAHALELEDDFDRNLGPATRRVGYFNVLPRTDLAQLIGRDVPRWEVTALRVVRPAAILFMKRSLGINRAGVDRSIAKIAAAFAKVGELLADGRPYLCGDRFTVADLTLASLAAPVLTPPQHPYGIDLPLSDEATRLRAGWRESPAGRHALRMYAEHRQRAN